MPRRHDTGFTLIELLVVIAIFVVLTAIIVPIGQRLRESNRTSTCEAHLAHIGQALKMYFTDEGGVPPVGVEGTLSGGPTGTSVDLTMWPSLQSLFVLGYLNDRNTLHCPRHTKTVAGAALTDESPEFYASYACQDPLAKPTGSPLRQYKYMPYRWALQGGYPNDYRRQLAREGFDDDDGTDELGDHVLQATIGSTDYLVAGKLGSRPPDDTIVTWCNYHADTYKLNRHGQYIALYWDGSVKLLDQELFRDDGVAPAEAWQIKPADIAH